MVDDKLFIPLLLGTNRKDRVSEPVARWMHGQMTARSDVETQFFDVRDFELPRDDYGTGIGNLFPEWKSAMTRADGLVIVTPEYNHGYPGILKSVLDLLLKEYIHKAVSFVVVSAGPWGGTRVAEAMLPVARELGFVATFTDLNFPNAASKFGQNGELMDVAYEKRVSGFLDELEWMSRTLKWGRANVPSRFHTQEVNF